MRRYTKKTHGTEGSSVTDSSHLKNPWGVEDYKWLFPVWDAATCANWSTKFWSHYVEHLPPQNIQYTSESETAISSSLPRSIRATAMEKIIQHFRRPTLSTHWKSCDMLGLQRWGWPFDRVVRVVASCCDLARTSQDVKFRIHHQYHSCKIATVFMYVNICILYIVYVFR